MAQDGRSDLVEKVFAYGESNLSPRERDFAVAAIQAGSPAGEDDVQGYGMMVVDRAVATGEVSTDQTDVKLSPGEFDALLVKLKDLTGELPQSEANELARAFWTGVDQTRVDEGGEVEGYILSSDLGMYGPPPDDFNSNGEDD